MRRVFEITITGIVVIDDSQPTDFDVPGPSNPDNWPAFEILREMQGTDVDVQEMQVISKHEPQKSDMTLRELKALYPQTYQGNFTPGERYPSSAEIVAMNRKSKQQGNIDGGES